MAVDLPKVEEEFTANVAPFIAEVMRAAAAVRELGEDVAAVQAEIAALQGKDVTIGIDVAGAQAAAAAVNDLADAEFKLSEASQLQVDTSRMFAETDAMIADHAGQVTQGLEEELDRVRLLNDVLPQLDEHTAGAARSVAAFGGAAAGAATGGMTIFGIRAATFLHWVIAAGAEFLAVFIPATVAAGSAALVMAQGFTDAQTHLTAMYDAQEATANIFHKTIGDMLGMGHALQSAQNAADPRVWELLGAGINASKAAAGGFVSEGSKVVGVLDNFAAKVVTDLQGSLGTKLHDLLGNGVQDLTAFGQVLGNVGHAVLNLADDMPGLAKVLLGVVDGASRLINVLSGMPGYIVTAYMALEEFNRWGSLAVGGMSRLGIASSALEGSFFTFGSRTVGIMSNVAKAVPMALAAITSNIGSAMTAWGRLGGEVEEGDGAFARMGKSVGNAGMAVRDFGADMTDATVAFPGWEAALGAVAVGGFIALSAAALKANNAMAQWAVNAEKAVNTASDLKVIPTITDEMANASQHYAQAQNQVVSAMHSTQGAAGDVASRYGMMTDGYRAATAAAGQATEVQDRMARSLDTVLQGAGYLTKEYGTSFIGALGLAQAAGVRLTQQLVNQNGTLTQAGNKIADYVGGMRAMGESSSAIGHDVTLLGIDSAEAATHVQQLQQAFSDFVANMTGGTSSLAGFNQALTNLTKGSNQITTILGKSGSVTLSVQQFAQDLTRFTGQGAQAWQNFDSVLTGSASQLVQWFQMAGSEGAVKGPQFSKALLDMASGFTGLASKSKTAQAELVGFFNAAGLNVKSFADLKRQIDAAGASTKDTGKIVQDVTGQLANMNDVAKALGSSIGSDIVGAMNQARVAASNLEQNAEALAAAWDHAHTVNAAVVSGFQQTYQSLVSVYHNTTLAKSAIDGMAQAMGMSQGQISQLNGMLGQLSGQENNAMGGANGLRNAIGAIQSKTVTVTADFVNNVTTNYSATYSHIGAQGGAKQSGGPVSAGAAYTVGERGRELFIPFASGQIIPNRATERALSGGGGIPASGPLETHIHNHVYLDGQQIFESVKAQTGLYNTRNGNPQSGRLAPR